MKNEDIIKQLKTNYAYAVDYYKDQRDAAKEDFEFRAGIQWNEDDKQARLAMGRPAETYNKLGQFVKQVVNSYKASRPEINVKCGDSTANRRTALILQAIIKDIQEKSFAENAYDTAVDCAVTGGEGYFRIVTEYRNALSFDQDIYIEAIDDPASVYVDPNIKSDYEDARFAFVTSIMTKQEYERQFPSAEFTSEDFEGYEDPYWLCEDMIKIVEYFYIEDEEQDIHLLEDGLVIYDEDYQKLKKKPEIKDTRKSCKRVVHWIKSNGLEVLEKTVFPGTRIPIIPVWGDTFILKGKRYMEGIIRQAKSSQKKQNYFLSTMNELVGLLGKAKYMMPEGSLEGHEHEWARMHTSSNPVLTYKPIDLNGNAAGPQPVTYSTPIDALSASIGQADNDLKSTIGIYDPSLGKEQTGEKSGVAILAKQRQSEVTNSMFSDNMCKSLKYAGTILLEIIPIIYDNNRIIRVAKDNDIEDEMIDLSTDLDVNFHMGQYTASVTIGPAGESQRQEGIEAMSTIMSLYPQAAPVVSDIWVSKMDFAGAAEIAERLKALNGQSEGNIPPEIQAQIQQAQQAYEEQIAALSQENQQQLGQMQMMQALIADLTSKLNRAKNDATNDTLKIISEDKQNTENNQTKIAIEMMKQQRNMQIPDSLLQATQPIPQVQMQDEYIIPGVNDVVTEESQTTPIDNLEQQQQQQDVEVDPRDEILQSLTAPRNSIR